MHASIPAFTRELAEAAGQLIVHERQAQAGLQTSYKDGVELVTHADVKADQYICDAIRKAYPGHRILAEESAPDMRDLSSFEGPLWIIDPIDGTVNYAHGHYQSAVSIAYAEQGRVHCGVVCNPFVKETFHAVLGGGAWLNEHAIQVAQKTQINRAIVATGFPYIKGDMTPLVRRLALVLKECADIRRLGAASLDICWVAMGRLDAYYENLSVWDFAAAQLIAREAGARYGHFKPVPDGISPEFHHQNILVANAALFPQMHELLNRADAQG
ncbi:MAG: inositol monophosphatase [Pseudomonadales bacterium]|nr:inositol monophosphatase [Pseudomonadales bacterium]MCP5357992.1 inositol monophosphatase [Pseudomonadales bacterium]